MFLVMYIFYASKVRFNLFPLLGFMLIIINILIHRILVGLTTNSQSGPSRLNYRFQSISNISFRWDSCGFKYSLLCAVSSKRAHTRAHTHTHTHAEREKLRKSEKESKHKSSQNVLHLYRYLIDPGFCQVYH